MSLAAIPSSPDKEACVNRFEINGCYHSEIDVRTETHRLWEPRLARTCSSFLFFRIPMFWTVFPFRDGIRNSFFLRNRFFFFFFFFIRAASKTESWSFTTTHDNEEEEGYILQAARPSIPQYSSLTFLSYLKFAECWLRDSKIVVR